MSGDSFTTAIFGNKATHRPGLFRARGGANRIKESAFAHNLASTDHSSHHLYEMRLSPWSESGAKRLFDCACVLLALPLLALVLPPIALAVRLTSPGPVFFLQKRMGRYGHTFTIFKFRTLIQSTDTAHHAITTMTNQQFTPVGSFLRRSKLDELPQLLNVLLGDMSLVGPRPKLPEHAIFELPCRPGITGAATSAFANEEMVLGHVPTHCLEPFYRTVILPVKRRLDAEYMARASFLSDLRLIVDSVLRRWDRSFMEDLLNIVTSDAASGVLSSRASAPGSFLHRYPDFALSVDRPGAAD